jgi:exopolysaccharide production protein ExoZ
MQPKNAGKFVSVQAARGIAALLVAIYHGQHVAQVADGGVLPLGGFFAFGHAGVEFFFVLSGFIIFYIHRSDLDKPTKLAEYMRKRIYRIYPLFLFVMVFVTAKFILKGEFDWLYFLKTVFLIPQPPYPMLIQSWTLVHEALFYLLFGVAILNLRVGCIALALWLAAFIFVTWARPDFDTGVVADSVATLVSPYNFLFLIGIAVAWLAEKKPLSFPRAFALAGAIGFIATGLAENNRVFEQSTFASVWLFGVTSGLMLLGLVSAEAAGSLRVGRVGELLGDLSYPLYLIHGAVISVTMSVLARSGATGLGWLFLWISVLAACVAALLVNRLVERPVAAFLRSRTRWRLKSTAV